MATTAYSQRTFGTQTRLVLPASAGKFNGVCITDLNEQTRAPRATAAATVANWKQLSMFCVMHTDNASTSCIPGWRAVGSPTYMALEPECSVCIGTASVAAKLNVQGAIQASGDVSAFVSDARLKTAMQPLADHDAMLDGLRACRFRWNELGQRVSGKDADACEVGFIAQEVQVVVPEVVCVNQAASAAAGQDGILSIAYEKLVAVAIACLQAQDTRLAALEHEVDDLLQRRLRQSPAT
ncbi:hypothetical protein COO60DRAFT_1644282 [Scenedesmus sp. NREL 46B-D3]|nr:hypothetical protein COO60DRAFT_1644282 [Scenedesmus sp. NREL 46B-D3]